jgi:hypothetical protein
VSQYDGTASRRVIHSLQHSSDGTPRFVHPFNKRRLTVIRFPEKAVNTMAKQAHMDAARHHSEAAGHHINAAEKHDMGNHDEAHKHSQKAHESSTAAHGKSTDAFDQP